MESILVFNLALLATTKLMSPSQTLSVMHAKLNAKLVLLLQLASHVWKVIIYLKVSALIPVLLKLISTPTLNLVTTVLKL